MSEPEDLPLPADADELTAEDEELFEELWIENPGDLGWRQLRG